MNVFINLAEKNGFTILRSGLVIANREEMPKTINLARMELNAAEMVPKKEDYIHPQVRALSQAYLGAGGYFLDFRKKGVLKESLPLMLLKADGGNRGKVLKVQRDHSYSVADTVGHVMGATWDGSKKNGSPGINAELKIDTVLAGDDARRMLSVPPLIDSVSMAVSYKWEKSHPELGWWTFFELLGQELDGETVSLVVTEILGYDHLGLVWSGGDSRASFLNHPQLSEQLNPEQPGEWLLGKEMFVAGLEKSADNEKKQINLPGNGQLSVNPNRSFDMNEEKTGLYVNDLDGVQGALGVEIANETELQEAIGALVGANRELKEARNELQAMVAALKPRAEIGDKTIVNLRANVIRMGKALRGDKFTEENEKRIKSADYEMLLYLEEDMQAQMDAKFPAAGRRSSLEELEEGGEKPAVAVNEADYKIG